MRLAEALVARGIPRGMSSRFDPTAARDLDAVFELRLRGSDTSYALRVSEGQLTVERGPAPEAQAQVSISAGDIARLVAGTVAWPALLAARRLELSGDPFLALRFPMLFRLSGSGSSDPAACRLVPRRPRSRAA